MNEKTESFLKAAAERIEARLKAAGFTVKPPEPRPANRLQATFIPRRRTKPEDSKH